MKLKTVLLVAALLAAALSFRAAESPAPTTAALQSDSARPASARWLRSELYFGVGLIDSTAAGVTDAQWRDFLDREVTPRFPDGLTVFDAYGQWRSRGHDTPGRLRSKVLVILHEDTPANRAALDAIRLAWKTATHHQSVLLVTENVDVSF